MGLLGRNSNKDIKLICWNCNEEIDIEFLDDVTNCPNCGEKISRNIPKVSKRSGVKKKIKKENKKRK